MTSNSEQPNPTAELQEEVKKELDRAEGENREKPQAEAEAVPTPEQAKEDFSQKAKALLKEFEALASKLAAAGNGEQAKSLLQQAREHHGALEVKLNKYQEQAEAVGKRSAAEAKVEDLHRQFNEAGGDEKKKVALRSLIEQAEEELSKTVKVERATDLSAEQAGLEQLKSGVDKLENQFAEATDFESLVSAIEAAGEVRGSNGQIFKAEELAKAVRAVESCLPAINSPMIQLITRTGGLRAKVIELLRPKRLENKRQEFAKHDTEVVKKYSGVTGWIRRSMGTKGYIEDIAAKNEAYEAYDRERAEAVFGSVDKMMDERIALVDARAEEFQRTKGWGSKVLDVYRNHPLMKKFKKFRLVAGVGLLGAGLAGVPVAAALGGGYLAWRLVGAGMGTAGSYDLMTVSAEKKGTKVALSEESEKELKSFKKGAKSEAKKSKKQISKEMKEYLKANKLTREQKKTDPGYLALKKKLDSWKEAVAGKKFELQTGEAKKLSDEDLDKTIDYFESAVALDGKKPSENPVYMMLMKEKASRYKGALGVLKGEAEGTQAEKQKGEDRQRLETMIGQKAEQIREVYIEATIDYYKQNYLVTKKLFEEMKAVKGTKEQRKKSPEYAAWDAGKEKLHKMYADLPPEVQTVIDRSMRDEMSKGRKQELLDIVDESTTDKIMGRRASEINEEEFWKEEWKLRPEVQAELNELMAQNEVIKQQAREVAVTEMEQFVGSVGEKERRVEAVAAAVNASLDSALQQIDADIKSADAARVEKGWTAVRQKRVRQALAVALGLVISISAISSWEAQAHASGGTAVTEAKPGGGPVPHDTPEKPVGPAPESEHPAPAVEKTGPSNPTPESTPAPVHEPTIEPEVAAGAGIEELPDKLSGTIHGGQGIHNIMDPILEKNGADMFPDVPDDQLDKFVHTWKIEHLKKLGFAFQKGTDGNWHYGYPVTVHEGAEVSIVKDAADPSGWRLELGSEHVTHHDHLSWPTLPHEAPSVEAPSVEASPVDASPVEASSEPPFQVDLHKAVYNPGAEVPVDHPVEAPVEHPAEGPGATADISRAGGSITETQGGGITERAVESYYNGTIFVSNEELVSTGILKEGWREIAKFGVNRAFGQNSLLNNARHIFAMREAMENAVKAGDTGAASALKENMETAVRMAERGYGDVFQL